MIDLQDRVAIVTGAGQGLGRAHALALAASGAAVVVNDIGVEHGTPTADKVVDVIAANHGSAIADHSDVSTAEGCAKLVASATAEFGQLDILVCNAGIVRDASFAKMDHEQWHDVLRVHLDGTYHLVRAAWPGMREQQYGRVVVTTSASGLYGSFGQANYSAAKMGLLGLMNTLAIEGAKYGVRINALSPVAATAMTEALMSKEMRQALDPAYAAPVVVFLASEACDQSGAIFHVRGDEYAAVKYYQSAAVSFGHPPTPDEFAAKVPDILDFSDSMPGAEAWSQRAR